MNGIIGRMKALKQGGFSLLELLVVIFILMILIAPIVGLIGYYGGRLVYPVEKSDTVTN